MDLAIGILEWPPSEFWDANPLDLAAAISGRRMANAEQSGTLSPQECEDLLAFAREVQEADELAR